MLCHHFVSLTGSAKLACDRRRELGRHKSIEALEICFLKETVFLITACYVYFYLPIENTRDSLACGANHLRTDREIHKNCDFAEPVANEGLGLRVSAPALNDA